MPALYLCSINEQVADITDAWKKKSSLFLNVTVFFFNKDSSLDQNHSCWNPIEICAAKLICVFYLVLGRGVWGGFCCLVFFNLCNNGTGKSKRNTSVVGRVISTMQLSKFAISPYAFEIQRQQLPSVQAAELTFRSYLWRERKKI